MALQLGWWPKEDKKLVKKVQAGERTDFGLEITGDDPTVTEDGTEGRVKILEAGGSNRDKGKSEVAEQRLICTFHGAWYRDTSGPRPALVFDVFTSAKGKPRKKSEIERLGDWEVQGYDPECYPGLGVDGFALIFVSRLFPVNFPFFLDSETEGSFIELEAVAESGPVDSPTTLATSKVLNVPIRRTFEVHSTTKGPDGLMPYTDKLIGNVVLHHESFLMQGAKPGEAKAQYIAIDPLSKGTFASYPGLPKERKLRIFMRPELVDDFTAGGTPAQKKAIREAITKALQALFEDAGLDEGTFLFLDEVPKELDDLAKAMKAGCSKDKPLTVPFFTFLVEQNNDITPVAHGESHKYLAKAASVAGGSYRLCTTLPIGEGDKEMREAIQFRSSFFRGTGEKLGDKAGEKIAQIIAHEVAHSLGLMHESEVSPKGTGYFVESGVHPLRSVMNSGTDDEPYGAGVSFSNQAKIIWRDAFGVTPELPTDSLKNKTWEKDGKNEWKTKDWSARKKVILTEIQESGLSVHRPDSDYVSPYGDDPHLPQPGTYAP